MASLELEDVSLEFRVRRHGRVTLKEQLLHRVKLKKTNPYVTVDALRDVNLKIGEGDRLGIIGHNGAGKSTLLKLMAGVYPPSKGRRIVHGRISSIFDISLGFEPDASGWENISFRSFLQGETPRSIAPKMKAIAEFSELGDFLNTPLRYYSAGMIMRLAFSIATSIEPEILLVDEVLAVGDMAFQQKARTRMEEMMNRARLIVIVGHDLVSLAYLCNRVVWMDHGRLKAHGPTDEIIQAYQDHTMAMMAPRPVTTPDAQSDAARPSSDLKAA